VSSNHKFWLSQYIPPKYITTTNKYNPSILEAVFRRQKAIMNDMVEKSEEEGEEEARFFLLLHPARRRDLGPAAHTI